MRQKVQQSVQVDHNILSLISTHDLDHYES